MKSIPYRFRSESGSALLVVLILSSLTIAGIVTYSHWSTMEQRLVTANMARQNARDLAESGLSEARLKLKAPDLSTFLPNDGSNTITGTSDKGRFVVELRRPGPDYNLVEAVSTGYQYMAAGTVMDNGKPALRSTIRALYRVTNISQYLWALPRSLYINPGTDISAGAVYGADLTFDTAGAPSQVSEAYYFNSVTLDNTAGVVWTNLNPAKRQPIRLPYPPTFPALDQAVRSFYQEKADTGALPQFRGEVSSPGGAGIYFARHDIEIGTPTEAFTVDGVYVIYSTGDVIIHNNILRKDANSWVGILAEGNITIAADAPAVLSINGTFMTNQYFRSATTSPIATSFTLNGGVVALLDVKNISARWPTNRTYTYGRSPVATILLPNFADVLDYEVKGLGG